MSSRKTRSTASTAVLAGLGICLAATEIEGFSRRELQTPSHAALTNNFCPSENESLSAWLHQEIEKKSSILPSRSTDFEGFLAELKEVLDARPLPDRPIYHLLSDHNPFQPTCGGDWMEFGVYTGDTINHAAATKQARCGDACTPVFGFDTFTGLPEAWARDDKDTAPIGAFNLDGKFPTVRSNVQLVKGIFAETLPLFELQHTQHLGNHSLSFLHIDCDLYSGAIDVLRILNNRIKFGTVIIFDDLVNYNKYREGEVKALWEWLQESGAKLATVGMLGPLENKPYSMDLNVNEPTGEHPWFHQSVAFVVAQVPNQGAASDSIAKEAMAKEAAADASTRDPILLGAAAMKGKEGLGALGHVHQKRVQLNTRSGRGMRGRRQGDADVRNRESIIPLDQLDVDPEGDVPQDAPLVALEQEDKQHVPADDPEALRKISKQPDFVSNLDSLDFIDNL